MTVKEIAEQIKDQSGARIRLTHMSLKDDDGNSIYTPALTDAQIIAYGNKTVVNLSINGKTVYLTVI